MKKIFFLCLLLFLILVSCSPKFIPGIADAIEVQPDTVQVTQIITEVQKGRDSIVYQTQRVEVVDTIPCPNGDTVYINRTEYKTLTKILPGKIEIKRDTVTKYQRLQGSSQPVVVTKNDTLSWIERAVYAIIGLLFFFFRRKRSIPPAAILLLPLLILSGCKSDGSRVDDSIEIWSGDTTFTSTSDTIPFSSTPSGAFSEGNEPERGVRAKVYVEFDYYIKSYNLYGCEYIGRLDVPNRGQWLVHKGNCFNPIHYQK